MHKLAAVLRWLAGGSHWDIDLNHGVAPTTLYSLIDSFVEDFLALPQYQLRFPFTDEAALKEIEAGFAARSCGVVRGCVGAIDGIVIGIAKPPKSAGIFCVRVIQGSGV